MPVPSSQNLHINLLHNPNPLPLSPSLSSYPFSLCISPSQFPFCSSRFPSLLASPPLSLSLLSSSSSPLPPVDQDQCQRKSAMERSRKVRALQQMKQQMTQERTLKLDAFHQVDELLSQVGDDVMGRWQERVTWGLWTWLGAESCGIRVNFQMVLPQDFTHVLG